MNVDQFLDRLSAEYPRVVRFCGVEVAAVCDLFQHTFRQDADWGRIRRATAIVAIPDPPPFLDEVNREWLGQAARYDWYAEYA